MAEKTFLIRMEPGPYRRELGAVVWDAGNNWTGLLYKSTAADDMQRVKLRGPRTITN